MESNASLDSQIKRQIEFYFSDSNFRRDRFLKQETAKHADGFIPLSVLLTFNKLASLTTDQSVVEKAIENSDVVMLNKEKNAIKRRNPLPEIDDSAERSLVLAGLGPTLPTVEEIKDVFQNLGIEPLCISRNAQSFKVFRNGKIFVEFVSEDVLKNVEEMIEKITFSKCTPRPMRLKNYLSLSIDDKREFDKAIMAMFSCKDVTEEESSKLFDNVSKISEEIDILRPRFRYIQETKEAYLFFTQLKFAEKFFEAYQAKPLELDGKVFSFEMITDRDLIKARPRRKKEQKALKCKERSKKNSIYITNIGTAATHNEVIDLIKLAQGENDKLPVVLYDKLGTATFKLPQTEAEALYQKLSALEGSNAELGGQKVQFHILKPSAESPGQLAYVEGLVSRFEVTEQCDSTNFKEIQERIQELLAENEGTNKEDLAYVSYNKTCGKGEFRFNTPESAKYIVERIKLEGIQVNDNIILKQVEALESAEERKFWEKLSKARLTVKETGHHNKRMRR